MTSNLFDLAGKTALVTGSSQGLGFMIAKGLGEAGATVILNGRDEQKLKAAVASLQRSVLSVRGQVFDVRDQGGVEQGIEWITQEIGNVDVLVNNAGIQIRSPLEQFNINDWKLILDVNLTGAFLVSKSVVQGMIQRRAGKIINIGSVQSELARPSIAPYTASKGGLRNLTKGMATDWGQYNIQVNGIAPGYFKTEMTKVLYQDDKFDAWLKSRVPARRWGNPEELIGAAVFLASKASDYINGQMLFVDGGLLACV